MKKTRVGFTIVELMVVIVVIAILTAMTVVSYTALQDRASDAKRKQDVAQITKLMALYELDNGPMYTNGEGCGGQGGIARGWFNRAQGPGTNYPRSVMQCFIDAGITTSEIKDEQVSCANNTDCHAYMVYSCMKEGRVATYVYANLQTISPEAANTDGTCSESIADLFGMDYYVRVN